MTNKTYKKLGALFRAPIIQHTSVLAITLSVIGMVTYVGLYNPRAGLAAAASPQNMQQTRAAPASKPGDLNGDNMVNALDLSIHLSSKAGKYAASDGTNNKGAHLEADMAVIMQHWTW